MYLQTKYNIILL